MTKILKQIYQMFSKLPQQEQIIFENVYGSIKNIKQKKHQEKQNIYNLLLWRSSSC